MPRAESIFDRPNTRSNTEGTPKIERAIEKGSSLTRRVSGKVLGKCLDYGSFSLLLGASFETIYVLGDQQYKQTNMSTLVDLVPGVVAAISGILLTMRNDQASEKEEDPPQIDIASKIPQIMPTINDRNIYRHPTYSGHVPQKK